ncbi:MAG: DUF177 domain-containing protein [Fimbriimonadaceae bacterium]|nr:DUF177 domain-containing protein [Fimbriimonadaceae bacterium]
MYLLVEEAMSRPEASWTAAFDELVDLEGDGSWGGRAHGELQVLLAGAHLRLAGDLTAAVPRECDLCLGWFLEPLLLRIEELVIIGEGGLEATFDDDAEVWRVGPEGRVSVTEIVRQAMLLELPTRAVCEAACPAREQHLTVLTTASAVDPRLAVLRNLLQAEVEDDGSPEEESQ